MDKQVRKELYRDYLWLRNGGLSRNQALIHFSPNVQNLMAVIELTEHEEELTSFSLEDGRLEAAMELTAKIELQND